MKAMKFIEKTIDGEYECIKNHVIDIDISADILEYLAEKVLGCDGSDPEEEVFSYGVLCDNDGVAYIKIGKFLDAIDKKVQATGWPIDDDNWEDNELDDEDEEALKKLREYRDYELWVKS
jgi:hypothetical protein